MTGDQMRPFPRRMTPAAGRDFAIEVVNDHHPLRS